MTLWLLLGAGFMMGLLGSPHCLGMCGGIVSAFTLSMRGLSDSKKFILIISYHIGRIISYMALGVLAALVGATVAPFMHSALPRVFLGVAIIFAALLMLGLPALKRIEHLGLGLWQKLSPIRQKLFPLTTTPKALFAGMLWGLLPCGLVYGAIAMAVGMGGMAQGHSASVSYGALFMLAFGLGTMPMLLATQSLIAFLQKTIKKLSLRQVSGALMLVSGLLVAVPAVMHAHHHGDGHGHSHPSHNHTHQDHANHNHHHKADPANTASSSHDSHHAHHDAHNSNHNHSNHNHHSTHQH